MNKFLCVSAAGELLYIATFEHDEYTPPNTEKQTFVRVDPSLDDQLIMSSMWFNHGTRLLQPRPSKPSEFHLWNQDTHVWEVTAEQLALARSRVKDSIEAAQFNLSNQPLEVGGIALDADALARDNLKSKLATIKERMRLQIATDSDFLVWRDADNTTHTWDNLTDYYDWLSVYSIAMDERNTRLYMAAWSKKAEVDALNDIHSILAYNAESGWSV